MSRRWKFALALIVAMAALSMTALAQSLITGDIAGTVTDSTGAVIPNATVNLGSTDTGVTQTATTNGSGAYRFSLLKPGNYQVSVAQAGFQKAERAVKVQVGQISNADLQLE